MDFIDLASQVPGLVVLAFIVIKFLHHLSKRAEKEDAAYSRTLDVIRENSKVLGEVHCALKNLNGK